MTTPATLLDDAFAEAIVYWTATNGGRDRIICLDQLHIDTQLVPD